MHGSVSGETHGGGQMGTLLHSQNGSLRNQLVTSIPPVWFYIKATGKNGIVVLNISLSAMVSYKFKTCFIVFMLI